MAMSKPKLYLFVGYPGAGKSHVARLIAARTGAVHLWADIIRQQMFPHPCHSRDESKQLYDRLNAQTRELLAGGSSVIFDTNFNFYDDRKLLRAIAVESGAETVLIWVNTPEPVARMRAVNAPVARNGYTVNITPKDFTRMVSNLQQPLREEHAIKIDGSDLDPEEVYRALDL
jgi:predicted kinase